MERQRATTQMAHYDDFSKALIESSVKYLGEEGIPSLQKKGNEDDFSKKDPKAKAAPADPAINLATGSGPKQSHGAEIKYTNVVKKEEVETEETTIEEAKNKEGKEQGADGKACWKGYKYAGTANGKDKCVKMKEEKEDESEAEEKREEKLSKKQKEKHEKAEEKAEKKAEVKEAADKKEEDKFHTKLDKLVHKTFGHSSDEKKSKKMKEEVTLQDIVEKAVSKSQQRFMGMVHAKKKGEMKDGSEKVDKAAASLTAKEAEKFASTKHKGLPEKKTKKEDYDVDTANQLWSEVGERLEKLGEMDDAKFKVIGEKLDPVGKEDKDIDNDGDHDKSDKYLLNRRKKVGKILAAKKKVDEMLALQQEMINEKKQ